MNRISFKTMAFGLSLLLSAPLFATREPTNAGKQENPQLNKLNRIMQEIKKDAEQKKILLQDVKKGLLDGNWKLLDYAVGKLLEINDQAFAKWMSQPSKFGGLPVGTVIVANLLQWITAGKSEISNPDLFAHTIGQFCKRLQKVDPEIWENVIQEQNGRMQSIFEYLVKHAASTVYTVEKSRRLILAKLYQNVVFPQVRKTLNFKNRFDIDNENFAESRTETEIRESLKTFVPQDERCEEAWNALQAAPALNLWRRL